MKEFLDILVYCLPPRAGGISISQILSIRGDFVSDAESPTEVMSMIISKRFDILVTDAALWFPKRPPTSFEDRLKLGRFFVEVVRSRKLKIIVLGECESGNIAHWAAKQGISGSLRVLCRPVDRGELEKLVDQFYKEANDDNRFDRG